MAKLSTVKADHDGGSEHVTITQLQLISIIIYSNRLYS